jgi:uncharacterized protein (UPF0261 family)
MIISDPSGGNPPGVSIFHLGDGREDGKDVALKKTVLLIGTLDTKGPEIDYMRQILHTLGLQTLVMDIGVVRASTIRSDLSRDKVCSAGGIEFKTLFGLRRRDLVMESMGKGAAVLARRLYDKNRIHGVLAVGGNQGTSIATTAMKALPLGVPKVMVSTVASGNTRPYIGNTDTAMMFSIADILGGPNTVTQTVLANAAGAIAGMCLTHKPMNSALGSPIVAVTAFGNLEPAVSRIGKQLNHSGYEAVTFHSSGAGGSAMEQLVEDRIISGVIDMVPHEILGELHPEDFYAPVRPGRLGPIVRARLPLVFVPGGLDYYVFGSAETIPQKFRKRKIHYHNPNNTNVRASARELREVGKVIAERLSPGADRIQVLIPQKGWTEFSKKGGPLYDPKGDAAFVSALRQYASPRLSIREVDLHVNDPSFADLCVESFHRIFQSSRKA